MHTYVNKRSKVGDVTDNTFQDHIRFKIRNFFYTILESCSFKLRTRIATGFLELVDNIFDGRQAKLIRGIPRRVKIVERDAVTDQLSDILAGITGDFLHNAISLRVHR